MHKYLSKPAILFFVLFSAVMYAQSTQTVCINSTHTYTVKGTPSGNYTWTVTEYNGAGTYIPTSGFTITDNLPPTTPPTTPPSSASSSSVNINWGSSMSTGINYKVKVTKTGSSPNLCTDSTDPCETSGEVMVTIVNAPATPLPQPSIKIKNNSAPPSRPINSVCIGTSVDDVRIEADFPSSSLPLPSGIEYRWEVSENGGGFIPLRYGVNGGSNHSNGTLVTDNFFTLNNTFDNTSYFERSFVYRVYIIDPNNPCTVSSLSPQSSALNIHEQPSGNINIVPVCGAAPNQYRALAKLGKNAFINKSEWNEEITPSNYNTIGTILSDGPITLNPGKKYQVTITDNNGCTLNNTQSQSPIGGSWPKPTVTITATSNGVQQSLATMPLNICQTSTNTPNVQLKADVQLSSPPFNSSKTYNYTYTWKKTGTTPAQYPTTTSQNKTDVLQVNADGTYTVEVSMKEGNSTDLALYDCPSDPSVTASVTVKFGSGNADFTFDQPVAAYVPPTPSTTPAPDYTASFCAGSSVKLKPMPPTSTTNLVGLKYEWKSGIPPNTTALVPAKSGIIGSNDDGSYYASVADDYTLTITDTSTASPNIPVCSTKSKTVRVTQNTNPSPPIVNIVSVSVPAVLSGSSQCGNGNGISLKADVTNPTQFTYKWYKQLDNGNKILVQNVTGDTYTDTDPITNSGETRKYTVELKNINGTGCPTESNPYSRIFNSPFSSTVSIVPSTGSLPAISCGNITLTANVTPPSSCVGALLCTYKWEQVGNNTSLPNSSSSSFTTTNTGTYSVTVTQGGCSITSSSSVTVNPLPTVVIKDSAAITAPLEICETSTTTLVAVGTTTVPNTIMRDYKWQKKDGNNMVSTIGGNSNIYSIPPNTAVGSADYTVTVTDSNSCTSIPSSPVTVKVNPQPDSTIETNNPLNTFDFCDEPGAFVLLKAINTYLSSPPGNFSFEWREVSNPIPVSTVGSYNATAGTYTLKVTDNITSHVTNCYSTTSTPITVTKKPLPVTGDINHD